MNINIERKPEQIELIKLMAHKNKLKAIEAQETFAGLIGPVIQQVLQLEPVLANFYKDLPYDQNSSPSIPLELYYDVNQKGLIKVWSQASAGGLATALTQGITELMVATYNLTSAVSFDKRYAAAGRLDVVSKTLERMAQEILAKKEVNAASVLFKALADARYTSASGSVPQIIRSNAANVFVPGDLLRLMTLAARINVAWTGGTPTSAPRGITDIVVSPEMTEQVKGWAFEPLNTRGTLTNIPGSEQMRNDVFRAAGNPSIYGVDIVQANELGVGYTYNTLFSSYIGSTSIPAHPSSGSAGAFTPASEEVVVAIDRTRDALLRPVQTSGESSTLEVMADDQFYIRSEKVGFFARCREGRVVVDSRALSAIIV